MFLDVQHDDNDCNVEVDTIFINKINTLRDLSLCNVLYRCTYNTIVNKSNLQHTTYNVAQSQSIAIDTKGALYNLKQQFTT